MKIFFSTYLRNRAIKAYVWKLAPLLVERYGACEQYTMGQLARTIQQYGLSRLYMVYAIALYRHEESFNTIKCYQVDQVLLDDHRVMLQHLLDLPDDYTAKDIIALSKPDRWRGGKHQGWSANRHGKTWF